MASEDKGNYIEERINVFEGMNCQVAPELIKETEGRQVYNLYPEKTGKLSTRIGYQFGAYLKVKRDGSDTFDPTITPFEPPQSEPPVPETIVHNLYPYNLGIYWIGEMNLENYWEEIDTDKLMVYAIIGDAFDKELQDNNSEKSQRILSYLKNNGYIVIDEGTGKYKIARQVPTWHEAFNRIKEFRLPIQYLFVPLTGKYRNIILDPYFLTDTTTDKVNAAYNVADWNQLPKPNPASLVYLRPFDWRKGKQLLRGPHRFWSTEDDYFNDLEIDVSEWFLNNILDFKSEQLKTILVDDPVRQFGKASWYQNALIISDPINGDQIIRDMYDFSEPNCDKLPHAFLIQPNCLDTFDPDIVEFDPRLNPGEENDIEKGVENGMGLYGYVLPKRFTKMTVDNADDTLTNMEFLIATRPEDLDKLETRALRELRVMEFMVSRQSTTLITAVTRSMYDGTNDSKLPRTDDGHTIYNSPRIILNPHRYSYIININNNYRRIFSNTQVQTEFVDLLGEVDFNEEKVVDVSDPQKIKTTKEKPADVYIWEDFPLTYYPTIGKEKNNVIYKYLFRDIDREFHKILPKAPRIVRLDPKIGMGKYAPLGIWNYKFVWDFGNGIFSAPSTVVSAPDIMWSAIKDEEMVHPKTNEYHRPVKLDGAPTNEWKNNRWIEPTEFRLTNNFLPRPTFDGSTSEGEVGINVGLGPGNGKLPFWDDFKVEDTIIYRGAPYKECKIIKNGNEYKALPTLTKYGELLWKLKHKLYNGVNGRYSNICAYLGETYTEDSNKIKDILSKGTAIIDFPVLVTGYFGDSKIETSGTAWQFVKLDFETYDDNLIPNTLKVDEGSFIISLFQEEAIGRSRFSLFDEEGRYRLGFLKKDKLTAGGIPEDKPIGRIFWAAPWRTQFSKRNDYFSDSYFTGGVKFRTFMLSREPFESWMNLYLIFYSDYDFHNLPSRYFKFNEEASRLGEEQISIYSAAFSQSYHKNTIGRYSYLCWYLYRPTNFIRGLRRDSDMNSLAVAGKNIPNEVYERLIKSGTIELQVVKPSDYIAPWYMVQEIYNFYEIFPGDTSIGIGPVGFASAKGNNNRYIEENPLPEEIVAEPIIYCEDLITLHDKFFERKIRNPYERLEYYQEDVYVTHVYRKVAGRNITIHNYVCNRPLYSFTTRGFYATYAGNFANIEPSILIDDYLQFARLYRANFHIPRSVYQLTAGYSTLNPRATNQNADQFVNYEDYYKYACLNNIEVYVYGNGHRLLAPEQLTAYFPSSLLFKAPRLGIRIKEENVPRLAKKLLIFRALNTNHNQYDPFTFGLVKEIEIFRDENGSPYVKVGDDKKAVKGIYWFDDVMEDKIDFSISPNDYEGLKHPLYSRFHITLNERTYYYNFIEAYRPETLRKNDTQQRLHSSNTEENYKYYTEDKRIPSSIAYVVAAENGFKTVNGHSNYTIEYQYSAEDEFGKIGEPTYIKISFSTTNSPMVVVLSLVPIPYDNSIKQIKLYRKITIEEYPEGSDNDFYLIGNIKVGAEGIYVDANNPRQSIMPCWDYEYMYYPTGLRWSEPYRPDWIKLGSTWTEYKGGLTGTGLDENYGNLVLFTDVSCARYTVQAVDPPISRVDELSPNIGCIAPNSLVNYNNSLIFLSWQGWMYYDNNVFTNIDDMYAHEISHLLTHLPTTLITYATGGIHQRINSFYLNMPFLLSLDYDVYVNNIFNDKYISNYLISMARYLSSVYYDWGDYYRFNKLQKIWGNIFVRNLVGKYGVKEGYVTTVLKQMDVADILKFYKIQFHSLGNVRLYYSNSLGELRSADIYPNRYRNEYHWDIYWSGIYIESAYPTSLGNNTPVYANYKYNAVSNDWEYSWSIIKELDEDVVPIMPKVIRWVPTRYESLKFKDDNYDYNFDYFPKPFYLPVRWLFFSKFFTANDETGLKRLRKIDANIYNQGPIVLRGVVLHREEEINYIVEYNLEKPNQNTFQFNSVNDYYSTPLQQLFTGRLQSVLSIIPNVETPPTIGNIDDIRVFSLDDWNAKPLKFSLEIYGIKRSTIDEIGFYWRPIHRYLL